MIKSSLLFLLCFCAVEHCFANPNHERPMPTMQTDTIHLEYAERVNEDIPFIRPRTSRPTLEAVYHDGVLTIKTLAEGIIQVEIIPAESQTPIIYTCSAPELNNGIAIGIFHKFSITCILPNDETFYGEYNNL